jgi:hypothetical protein
MTKALKNREFLDYKADFYMHFSTYFRHKKAPLTHVKGA